MKQGGPQLLPSTWQSHRRQQCESYPYGSGQMSSLVNHSKLPL